MPAQQAIVSEYVRSMNGFSGVDMKASFGNVTIGELQAFSYSITREKAPVFTMGSPDARAFSRGKRGIAGSLIFIVFDNHALLTKLRDLKFQADKDSIHPAFMGEQTQALDFDLSSTSGVTPSSPIGGGIAATPAFRSGLEAESAIGGFVDSDQEAAHPWYVDQIPPFNITLSAANEYGALAVMKVFGVEILNEGYGISIDDLNSEIQCTWIGRGIHPWSWVRPNDFFINRPVA